MKPSVVALLYPGCIFFEISLALELFAEKYEIVFATPNGEDHSASNGAILRNCLSYSQVDLLNCKAILVPGGDPGSIKDNIEIESIIRDGYERGIWLAAICAGPSVLAKAGILRGNRIAHGYGPEQLEFLKKYFEGVELTQEKFVADGNILTAKPDAHIEFAVELACRLGCVEAARVDSVKNYYRGTTPVQKNEVAQPRLETNRLILEPYKDSDASDVFEYASRSEVTKFLLWEPHKTLEDSQKFLHWVKTSTSTSRGKVFFVFALRLKENGKVIGSIDFKNPQPWVGQIDYAMHVDHWGKGLMAEAACAIRDWAFDTFDDLARIQSYCDPENVGSRRVMEKIGLTFEGIRKKSFKSKGQIIDLAHYALVRDL